jgi:hypothetical protein
LGQDLADEDGVAAKEIVSSEEQRLCLAGVLIAGVSTGEAASPRRQKEARGDRDRFLREKVVTALEWLMGRADEWESAVVAPAARKPSGPSDGRSGDRWAEAQEHQTWQTPEDSPEDFAPPEPDSQTELSGPL